MIWTVNPSSITLENIKAMYLWLQSMKVDCREACPGILPVKRKEITIRKRLDKTVVL